MQKPNDKYHSEYKNTLCSAKLWKQCFQFLSSDPNVRKEWLNFICNEDQDCVSKNLVLCSLNFTTDLFTNKAQFDAGFSKRLKLKDDAVPTILDPTIMSQHTIKCNCFYYMVTIALSVFTDYLLCIEYLCIFNLNHSSV